MRRHKQTWQEQIATEPNESVQVYIRSRPLLEHELVNGYYSLFNVQAPYTAHVTHPTIRWAGGRFATNTYQADGVFAEDAMSEGVYRAMNLSPLVRKCGQKPGSNVSLIAYGQTGSGKTYSTTAIEGRFIIYVPISYSFKDAEFVVEDLFTTENIQNNTSTVSLSIFELQGNSCRDLLSTPPFAPVTITTTNSQEVSYGNLGAISVNSKDDILTSIRKAKGLRLTRSTLKNDTSSR